MSWFDAKRMYLKKLHKTLKNYKQEAHYYYGKKASSYLRYLYYSGMRINTFYVYQNDLERELPKLDLDSGFRIIKPTTGDLDSVRRRKVLPREFYYDKILNARTCYLAFKDEEVAYIHWVFFKGDYSRFLILTNGVAELNYNTTLPKFRGRRLCAKMVAYISKDLQELGYEKVMGIIHEHNVAMIKCIEEAGFKEIKRIRSVGPFNRKYRINA